MARRGDTRSPSTAGNYSSSSRRRRDDDRISRDARVDRAQPRRRSRSPGTNVGSRDGDQCIDSIRLRAHYAQRKYRDRDIHRDTYPRGHRSPERRANGETYHSSRRDRSPDQLGGKDGRHRSRDREYKELREHVDDKSKRLGDESGDSRHKRRREEGKDAQHSKSARGSTRESPKLRTTSKPTKAEEDRKKADRLAKLELWKQRQATERDRKQREMEAAGGARALLNEMDKKSAESVATASPTPPATPQDPHSVTAFAGKFEPKLVVKRATASHVGTGVLGNDFDLSKIGKASASLDAPVAGVQANQMKLTPTNVSTVSASVEPLKAKGNLSGFGLSSKAHTDSEKHSNKPGINFGDEESTRKRLEKLPTPPLEDVGETTNENREEDDADVEMEDADNEEEAAAAARSAAEKREERLAAESLEASAQHDELQRSNERLESVDASKLDIETVSDQAEPMDMEEVDALDAFMSVLVEPGKSQKAPGIAGIDNIKTKQQEPEALFSDDDDELSTINANPSDILDMATKARPKKKDLPKIDHAKANYEPFRKDFYSPAAELANLSEEELANLRLSAGITVKGNDVPAPVLKFSQLGLGKQAFLDVLQKLGFETPTSIQSQAIPAISSGRDVIGIAKTGSGKTMAFLLPMFRHILDQKPLAKLDGPIGIILSPTRELAIQIHKECKPWLKALNLRAVCAFGGEPIKYQIAELKRGAEILLATPGRLIDLLSANQGRVTNLRRCTIVVLDEADRMFDMGFEPQVMKILANIRPQRQTVLFSATFNRSMEALARKTLNKPVEILVGGKSVVAPEIQQVVEVREEETKFVRVLQLLGDLLNEDEDAKALIFVERQEKAEEVMQAILKKGYPTFTSHGGKDQSDRMEVMDDFKRGIFPVLIATSLAARGLDVKNLKLVVNYDAPRFLEDYVHRAGRTGRAGNTGRAVTFITEGEQQYSGDIAKALKQSGQDIPEELQKLVDSFQDKVKAGKEKVTGSGFGGKGLDRLDQERDAVRNRERKVYKTGDEPEEEEKKEEEVQEEIVVKPAGAPSTNIPGVAEGIEDLMKKIKVHKTEVPVAGKNQDKMSSVTDAVAAINARLRKTGDIRGHGGQTPIDNKGPDAGAFHATLEINDFPQKARWSVTNRTNVAKILEATGTSITSKGIFYPSGTSPTADQPPKLYILVEGDTEVVVTNAMRELMRLLKEGTTAAMDSEARAPVSGRYTVV